MILTCHLLCEGSGHRGREPAEHARDAELRAGIEGSAAHLRHAAGGGGAAPGAARPRGRPPAGAARPDGLLMLQTSEVWGVRSVASTSLTGCTGTRPAETHPCTCSLHREAAAMSASLDRFTTSASVQPCLVTDRAEPRLESIVGALESECCSSGGGLWGGGPGALRAVQGVHEPLHGLCGGRPQVHMQHLPPHQPHARGMLRASLTWTAAWCCDPFGLGA